MHPAHRALALLVCLAGGTAAAGPDTGSERLRVVDAAERCAEFWRRVPGATPERQARVFEELLRAPHPTLYTTEVLGLDEPLSKSVPERLAKAPARFRPDPVRVDEVRRSTEKAPDIPPRTGYLLGWWIAEAEGKTRSLAQLAAMTPAESRVLVEDGLRTLAQSAAGDPRSRSTEKTSSERRTSSTK